MAEALLRHRLDERGLSARVSSTGLTFDGRPATAEAAEVLRREGLDLSGHVSRTITAEQLDGADLVLGMERRHVREAYLLSPGVLTRAFTLPEFVRRASSVGPCRGDLAAWTTRVAAGRRLPDLVGESAADEVADPFGSPIAVYERTAAELDRLCTAAADLLTGRRPARAAATGSDPTSVGAGSRVDRGSVRSRLWRR
jgi:protein-tyrosine phosphatase